MTDLTKLSWKQLAEYHYYGKMRKAELVKKWRRLAKYWKKESAFHNAWEDIFQAEMIKSQHGWIKEMDKVFVWQLIALIFLGGFLYLVIWK